MAEHQDKGFTCAATQDKSMTIPNRFHKIGPVQLNLFIEACLRGMPQGKQYLDPTMARIHAHLTFPNPPSCSNALHPFHMLLHLHKLHANEMPD